MNLNNQELLFSILHDGSVVGIRNTADGIEFTVEIKYLAERIKPHFKGIIVKLNYPSELYLEDIDTKEIIRDFEELSKLDTEILKADINADKVRVFCSISNGQSFGYLNVKASEIYIYDPEHNPVCLEDLKIICKSYWDDFSKRGR
ncbi:hypothetical protein [Paenibacillus sp. N3.4]|uniref:hypothetical protein n=1 Tax=Paenibacillus sp. N3.4 TaxID=2603222 RepID=UPI0011CA268C|nr:hypothetical protein [Paenibacillus sp. N3.4]TXK84979.1 hypothetical protein FU659_05605 [Paenibacillus sp. N3.4]